MDNSLIFKTIVLPVIRHGLQGVAGYLVALGQLDPANGETLAGALLGLVTVGWWYVTRPKPAAK